MSGVFEDLRYALRQLRRTPAFAITAFLTLALGIGTNTALFSVVNAVLRHPAGVDHPERLAVMHTRYSHFTLDIPYASIPVHAALATLDQVEVAAVEHPAGFNTFDKGTAEHTRAAAVSAPWFRLFGAQPILGRTFTTEEDQPSAGPVVELSYGIWQRTFGGRSDVLGKTLLLDDKPYRVIGVMRSDFAWPRRAEIWTPVALPREAFQPDEAFDENYYAFVGQRPGVSTPQYYEVGRRAAKAWKTVRSIGRGRGEPVALIVAAGALVYTGLIAGGIPARRALKVDPMVTLRYD